VLEKAVRRTNYAVSSDESRPMLAGALLQFNVLDLDSGPRVFHGELCRTLQHDLLRRVLDLRLAWDLGCTVAPGFEFAKFELAPKDWEPR
jgi:hypothetical protein